jgi:drug/metabolite transporter (DMT)-like permease
MNQSLYYQGVDLGSPSMAAAMANLIPAITFVMAATVGYVVLLKHINHNSFLVCQKIVLLCIHTHFTPHISQIRNSEIKEFKKLG